MSGIEQEVRDDPGISDDDRLWRHVHPFHWIVEQDRPSSQAFQNASDGSGMSVDLARMRAGPEESLATRTGWGLVELVAGFVRHQCGQVVMHKPERDNPAHAEVVGPKTKSVRNRMKLAARTLVRPTQSG